MSSDHDDMGRRAVVRVDYLRHGMLALTGSDPVAGDDVVPYSVAG